MGSVREVGGELWVEFKEDPWGTLDLLFFFGCAGVLVGIGKLLGMESGYEE